LTHLNLFPLYTKKGSFFKKVGVLELLENTDLPLKALSLAFKDIFFRILKLKKRFFQLERDIKLFYLLCLATHPQGETSGLLVFVLPPWGLSTGFLATPLTLGLCPIIFKLPAFPKLE